jgi:hypothetical protein
VAGAKGDAEQMALLEKVDTKTNAIKRQDQRDRVRRSRARRESAVTTAVIGST